MDRDAGNVATRLVLEAVDRARIHPAGAGGAGHQHELAVEAAGPDEFVDGQPGEETITALVVDGVLTAVCQARAGLDDSDPLLAELLGRLEAVAGRATRQLDRLTEGLLVLATAATILSS